mmetsp:Transcript_28726/g.95425  ORF Transcript_28726/g.95425 Transcript_28726/m.95425 type:complete len:218 (-) Transcript_28726:144-797(-)
MRAQARSSSHSRPAHRAMSSQFTSIRSRIPPSPSRRSVPEQWSARMEGVTEVRREQPPSSSSSSRAPQPRATACAPASVRDFRSSRLRQRRRRKWRPIAAADLSPHRRQPARTRTSRPSTPSAMLLTPTSVTSSQNPRSSDTRLRDHSGRRARRSNALSPRPAAHRSESRVASPLADTAASHTARSPSQAMSDLSLWMAFRTVSARCGGSASISSSA